MQQDSRNDTNPFYDAIADYYHLFYRDWRAALERDGSALRRMFRNRDIRTVLDASCGPGTQAIALAMHQFEVTAADPSRRMIQKARENAREFEVADDITFVQAGFLELSRVLNGPYDAVITKGNSLPHLLSDEEISCALQNFFALLRPGGLLVIGMRDFDMLLEDRPRFVPRQAHLDDPERDHILFDVWDWHEGPPVTVTFNTFLVSGKGDEYAAARYPVTYRALRRAELNAMLERIGFVDIQVEDQNWEVVFSATKPG